VTSHCTPYVAFSAEKFQRPKGPSYLYYKNINSILFKLPDLIFLSLRNQNNDFFHDNHNRNEKLSSRQHQKKIITDIEIGENKISSALEMAEAFNCHFANIEHDLAKDIPPTVKEPEYYLNPTNKTFSLNNCSTSEVQKLLENLEVKKLN